MHTFNYDGLKIMAADARQIQLFDADRIPKESVVRKV